MDNAATGFSLIACKRIPVVYRLSVNLKEEIDLEQLKLAISNILPRYPYYRVSIKKGLFWGRWQLNLSEPEILSDVKYSNNHIPLGTKNLLYRIYVKYNRLSIECHHALTDGTGSMMFFKSIIVSYLQHKHKLEADWEKIFHPDDEINPLEFEDAFDKYLIKKKKKPVKQKGRSFNIPIRAEKTGIFHVTKATISASEIIAKAKEYNVSISVFLTAVYLDSLREIQQQLVKKKKIKPIRINVSVDLRRLLPSKTMRIFSLLTTPSIYPKKEQLDFQKIISSVEKQLREDVTPEKFQEKISQNIRSLSSPIMNITPFLIKRFFARKGYYFVRTPFHSGILSNLGKVELPEKFEEYIEHFDVIVGPSPVNKVRVGVVSFQDKMSITFGRVIKEPLLAETYCRKLREHSVEVKVKKY